MTEDDKLKADAETLDVRFGFHVLAHSVGKMPPAVAKAEIEKFRRRLKTSLANHKFGADVRKEFTAQLKQIDKLLGKKR